MRRDTHLSRANFTIVAALTVLAACSSSPRSTTVGGSPTATTSSPDRPSAADPLVGIWQSTTKPAQMKALAISRFPEARTAPWRRWLGDAIQQNGGEGLNTIHFAGGQLVVSLSADGGPTLGEWEGTYEVVDKNTFVAGDGSNGFYLTYRYLIRGDRLTVQVVKDLFPDDVGPNPPPVPDLLPQVLLWETEPFTKVG